MCIILQKKNLYDPYFEIFKNHISILQMLKEHLKCNI